MGRVPAAAWIVLGLAAQAAAESPVAERLEAIRRIAERRGEDGIPALREAAASGNVEVRVAAIAALGEYAREDQFALLRGLAREGDPRIAGAAVRALGLGGFAALPFLLDALRHDAAGVREAAGAAMQRVAGVRADPAILAEACVASKGDRFAFLEAILERDAGPRATADALRALPDAPQSVSPLVRALGADFEPVRDAARGRLEALACRRMDDEGWREWGKRRWESVLAMRADAWHDAGNPLRAAAARALAVPEKAAVEALMTPGEGAAEETALRSLAVATGLRGRSRAGWQEWWGANRDRARLEWLLAALLETGDAPNRAAAARALAAVRDRRAVDHLLAYGARDADPVVREASIGALRSALGKPGEPAEALEQAWKGAREDWK